MALCDCEDPHTPLLAAAPRVPKPPSFHLSLPPPQHLPELWAGRASPQVSTRTSCSSMLRMAASELSTTSSPVRGCVMMQLVEFRCPLMRNLGSKALWNQTEAKPSGLQMTQQSLWYRQKRKTKSDRLDTTPGVAVLQNAVEGAAALPVSSVTITKGLTPPPLPTDTGHGPPPLRAPPRTPAPPRSDGRAPPDQGNDV